MTHLFFGCHLFTSHRFPPIPCQYLWATADTYVDLPLRIFCSPSPSFSRYLLGISGHAVTPAEPEETLCGGMKLFVLCMPLWSTWYVLCCSCIMLLYGVLCTAGQVQLPGHTAWPSLRSRLYPRRSFPSYDYLSPTYLGFLSGTVLWTSTT